MQLVWYTAMSMDGRIAGAGDDLSFLELVDGTGEEGDFDAFMADIDALLVGSGTLRWLHREGHELPWRGLPIWLLTSDEALAARAMAVDPEGTPVTHATGDVASVLDEMADAGHRRAWLCGGGDVAGQALAADRIDEVRLTIAPTVLGAGPAIFDHAELPLRRFTLVECREYGRGSVRLRWERDRRPRTRTARDELR